MLWNTILRKPFGDFGCVACGTTLESTTSHTVLGGLHQPQIAKITSPPIRSLRPFKIPPSGDNPTASQTGYGVPRTARELHHTTCGRQQLGEEEREKGDGEGGGRKEGGADNISVTFGKCTRQGFAGTRSGSTGNPPYILRNLRFLSTFLSGTSF